MAASNTHKDTKLSPSSSAQSLVLYGLDEAGKPRAACFAAKDAALAKKAAGLMGLTVLLIASPQQVEIAAKLPPGSLYSSGRGLVPNVRAALYGKLVEAATGVSSTGANGSKVEEQKPGFEPNSKSGPAGKWPPGWGAIDVGHVVIAQEAEKELGWAEAAVVRKDGDMFTLRWKDPPNKKLITRHRLNLALLHPSGRVDTASKGLASTGDESSRKVDPSKRAVPKQSQAGPEYPIDWSEVDVGSLVLAKEDGPMQSWWEAVVTMKDGDALTLQWRDYTSLPTVVRVRSTLGLLCPTSLAAAQSG